jgi:hypothetical protein
MRESPQKVSLSEITAAKRDAVVMLLRDVATHKVTSIGAVLPDAGSADIILLRLNDKSTIERMISAYRASYGSRGSFWLAEHLELAAQAAVIPYLAEDFFLDDGDKSTIVREGVGGLRVIPRSAFSGLTTLRIAAASEQFGMETRAWAKQRQTTSIYPLQDFRTEMRRWWRENETAFRKGEYQAVRPWEPEAPPAGRVSPSTPPPAPSVLVPAPTVPAEPAANAPTRVAQSSAAMARHETRHWGWVIGAGVLVVIALFGWKRQM